MEAIVLAGGFGTRLRRVVSNVPKPMAPIDDAGTPFLAVLLRKIAKEGINKIILSTGYMHEIIEQYFGDSFANMSIIYSNESSPLGTGGAVKEALSLCSEDNVFVLNGDTYFDVDLRGMYKRHVSTRADITIAIKEMHNFDRYGNILIDGDNVTAFQEKKYCKRGFINGGIYCLSKKESKIMPEGKFSFEKDFMEKQLPFIKAKVWNSRGIFIDIGIPSDYEHSRKLLANNVEGE